MVSARDNERLTRVGPGTPMGTLMRRYWHPVAAAGELAAKPVKAIRILGEDLVLYRDGSSRLGLVGNRCAHRLVQLEFGYPVADGLRCPYHGWTYDGTGACVAQPAEPPESAFKEKVRITAYPVEELSGLIFAYLGPAPAPLLPRWEPLVMEGVSRRISFAKVPANWLQAMEMSPDQIHVEWVHGHFGSWILGQAEGADPAAVAGTLSRYLKHAVELDAQPYEYGLLRRRVIAGGSRADESWAVGQPVLFPSAHLTSGGGAMNLSWRVPDDDTHSTEWVMRAEPLRDGTVAASCPTVPFQELHFQDANGRWDLSGHYAQDHIIFIGQGEVLDRSAEHLTPNDAGVIAYRQLLLTQLERSEAGAPTMNVFRDPELNRCLELPVLGRSRA